MKTALPLLVAIGAASSFCVASVQAQMTMPTPKSAPMERPADPGMDSPANTGTVVVPPSTGNEEMVRKPKNVDPKIDDATGDINRRNRDLSEDKGRGRDQPR